MLERLFLKERRRLKNILNSFGEKAVLKLMFATVTKVTERWRAVKVTDFEHCQMADLRKELDDEYEANIGCANETSMASPQIQLYSTFQT